MNASPQVNLSGITPGSRPLFHTRAEIALLKDSCVKAGFGVLKAGTVLATCVVDELMTPNPTDAGSATLDVARARLTATATGTTLVVTEADGAKFRVGDSAILNNNSPVYQDLGLITAIATADGLTTLTVTETVSGTFTTAANAAVSHKTAAASPFYAASCFLDKDLDAGTSATEQPAPTSICFGNAILYTASLTGMSAKAVTDLGASQHGVHTIIK